MAQKSEKVKKDIQQLFKENELDIVIQCNMKTVNYFDVTLNLENPTYRPHQKENNQIKYINIESNHPPSIIKQHHYLPQKKSSTTLLPHTKMP